MRARHGSVEGEYALFMPMTTEQSTTGGRETFGEPKKIGQVGLKFDGDQVSGRISRMGSSIAELSGTLGSERPGYEKDKIDFYFKALPNPSGEGLDGAPALVYCRRHKVARVVRPVTPENASCSTPPSIPSRTFPCSRRVLRICRNHHRTERGDRRPRPSRVGSPVHAPALRRPVGPRSPVVNRLPGSGADRYIVISADGHAGLPARTIASTSTPSTTRLSTASSMSARHTAKRRSSSTTTTSWAGRPRTRRVSGRLRSRRQGQGARHRWRGCRRAVRGRRRHDGNASPPFGAGLMAGAIEDPELAFAGARAHNRFLADMCCHAPHRRAGIALVPITHDVHRAVKEVEWVAASPGSGGS